MIQNKYIEFEGWGRKGEGYSRGDILKGEYFRLLNKLNKIKHKM